MNPNKALLEKGDFTQLAETMRESGAALVAKLGITKDLKVLDLGCGDGELARWCLEQGAASIIGVDLSARMLGLGR